MAVGLDSKKAVKIYETDWSGFQRYFTRMFRQGDHVSLIGSTGCGKTTLAFSGILPIRDHVAILATKPKDPALTELLHTGYVKLKKWPPEYGWERRVLLWPNASKVTDVANQAAIFGDALSQIYETGAWCIYVDELHYMIDTLKMERLLSLLWQQGRSIDISLIASMQRPSKVPLLAYTQATHLFFWRCNDETDLKRIGGIGWQNSKVVRDVVSRLYGPPGSAPRNKCCQFLYVNARSGDLIVSRLEV
jgi:energy-coupling factor transporter ATP-binding protein EcfA2